MFNDGYVLQEPRATEITEININNIYRKLKYRTKKKKGRCQITRKRN
jgi:hypothetical protein